MTNYDTRIENYGPNGLINTEVIHNILTGEAELQYLAPDKVKAAYATLRTWSADAQNTADIWATLSNAQKDARMQVTYQRLATFFDRFADLLLLEGRT
jgi:hypothetical protein